MLMDLDLKLPFTITIPIWAVDKLDDMVIVCADSIVTRYMYPYFVQDMKLQNPWSVQVCHEEVELHVLL
jgi:hypothetical protein